VGLVCYSLHHILYNGLGINLKIDNMNSDKEIKAALIEMLGKNAYNNSMQVTTDTAKLIKCVDYLTIQLNMIKRWCDDEGKRHIDDVINNIKNILNPLV
jgi:hypothetical protein